MSGRPGRLPFNDIFDPGVWRRKGLCIGEVIESWLAVSIVIIFEFLEKNHGICEKFQHYHHMKRIFTDQKFNQNWFLMKIF